MSSETNLQQVLPAWLELASKTDVSLGLGRSEAFERAQKLLNDLRSGQASTEGWVPDADKVEVLHALVALVCRPEPAAPKEAPGDVEVVFNHLSALPWSSGEFGGPAELVSDCTLQGWRLTRLFAAWPEVEKWRRRVGTSTAFARAENFLAVPLTSRRAGANLMGLEGFELFACICEILRPRPEADPAQTRDEVEFFYGFLEKADSKLRIGDERSLIMGELALIGGAACRILFRTKEADDWLGLAEAHFAAVQNPSSHVAQVAYQRLALKVEERQFDEVIRLVPPLVAMFSRLEMNVDAIKCRFLEGTAFTEAGEPRKAVGAFLRILEDAERAGSARLAAQALNNIARVYADLGDAESGLQFARRAFPLLQQLGSQVTLVKLRWTIGELLRMQGNHAAALEAYREALSEATELGLRADVVSIHLVAADLLLETGQDSEAAKEIRAALPIIDEEQMVPEGVAALSLLRESLRRRQIDHGALRDLHRHMEERSR